MSRPDHASRWRLGNWGLLVLVGGLLILGLFAIFRFVVSSGTPEWLNVATGAISAAALVLVSWLLWRLEVGRETRDQPHLFIANEIAAVVSNDDRRPGFPVPDIRKMGLRMEVQNRGARDGAISAIELRLAGGRMVEPFRYTMQVNTPDGHHQQAGEIVVPSGSVRVVWADFHLPPSVIGRTAELSVVPVYGIAARVTLNLRSAAVTPQAHRTDVQDVQDSPTTH